LFVYLFICLFVYLFIRLFFYSFIFLFFYLFNCLNSFPSCTWEGVQRIKSLISVILVFIVLS
ncbi:MAG TPA: hypothetical protein PKY56_10000, partial [Candidatus Kapabacteria bacterium]|nr:hypothetical protein [Candidatus Kapabacteria bacterium]